MRRLWAVAAAVVPLVGAGAAHGASLSISVLGEAVEDTPVRIVAAGSADDNQRLWTYLEPSAADCAPTAELQKQRSGALELTFRYVPPGPFSDTTTPTLYDAAPYRACAYLGTAQDQPPAAAATLAFDVREPTSALRLSARRSANGGTRVVVRGRTEVGRRVAVYLHGGRASCAPTAYAEAQRRSARELVYRAVSAGRFSEIAFTRARRPGRICGYVTEAQDAVPNARATLLLRTR